MNLAIEFIVRSVLIGDAATFTMDLGAAALRRLGVPSLDLAFLGRWIGLLRRGRRFRESIARAAPVRGELLIGWCAHYSIGASFAALLLAVFGVRWARSPTLPPAPLIGLVTVAAPLLILQPALGAGIASSRTPFPVLNSVKSLITHGVFGLGLHLAARATAPLLPAMS